MSALGTLEEMILELAGVIYPGDTWTVYAPPLFVAALERDLGWEKPVGQYGAREIKIHLAVGAVMVYPSRTRSFEIVARED